MIESRPNELTIYYHSEDPLGRQVVAYATAYTDHIRTIDLSSQKLTGTRLEQIALQLNQPLQTIINMDADVFERAGVTVPEDDNDIIKLIQHHPDLLRGPIIIGRREAFIAKSAGDVISWLDQYAPQNI